MNTMESLGNGPSVVGKSDSQPLSLEANAETLALFAGLFALIQPDQTGGPGDATQSDGIATDQPSADTASATAAATAIQTSAISAHAVPAAAKLFADSKIQAPSQADVEAGILSGASGGDLPVGAGSEGDVTALVRLLLAAQEIAPTDPHKGTQQLDQPNPAAIGDASPDAPLQPGVPVANAISGADAGREGQGRTAAEMLSGALEILKSLEAATTTRMTSARDAVTASTQANTAGASPDAVPPVASVASVEVKKLAPAASADFVGPMPAADLSISQLPPADLPPADLPPADLPHGELPNTRAVLAPTSADFVGPMPAATLQAMPTSPQVNPQANPQAMGPWPAVAMVPVKADFVGPMPAPTSTQTPTPVVVAKADFVGPMPAPTSTQTPTPVVVAKADLATGAAVNPAVDPSMETVLAKQDGQQVVKSSDQMAAKLAEQKLEQKAMEKGAVASKARAAQQIQNAASGGAVQISAASSAASSAAASSAYASAEMANQTSGQASSQTNSQTAASSANAQTGGQSNGQNGGQNNGQGNAQPSAQHAMDASQSRGSADRTLLHRLNTDQAGWSESMVRRLTSDLRAGIQTVRIVLEPRHLGRLNVELGLRDGKASIRIAAETAEAAKLLSGARGQLGQMFESAGMRLAGFQASNAGADLGGHAGQGQDGQAGGENAGGNKDFANKMGAATGNAQDADSANADAELQPRAGETAVLSILA